MSPFGRRRENVNQGHVAHRVEYLGQGVAHWEDEAGGELAEFGPRVHQRGGVREELQADHRLEELVLGPLDVAIGIVCLGSGHRPRHSHEHLARGLADAPRLVAQEISALEDLGGADREFQVVGHAEELLGAADLGAALAIEDVGFGQVGAARLDEHSLDDVLDFLDGGAGAEARHDLLGAQAGEIGLPLADGAHRLGDCGLDLGGVEALAPPVALYHKIGHRAPLLVSRLFYRPRPSRGK